MSQDPVLLSERRETVQVLTLNRPAAANALDSRTCDALIAALAAAAADAAVRAAVLTAAGVRVFSAGADLKEIGEAGAGEMTLRRRALLLRTLLALLDFPKPLLCAVQGKAIGAGCMLAFAADEVLAAEGAEFSFPEIRHDMPSPMGAAMVAARAGRSAALRLIQNGDALAAPAALDFGLIDAVVSREALLAQALERAAARGELPAHAYRGNKQWLNRALRADLEQAAAAATQLQQNAAIN